MYVWTYVPVRLRVDACAHTLVYMFGAPWNYRLTHEVRQASRTACCMSQRLVRRGRDTPDVVLNASTYWMGSPPRWRRGWRSLGPTRGPLEQIRHQTIRCRMCAQAVISAYHADVELQWMKYKI